MLVDMLWSDNRTPHQGRIGWPGRSPDPHHTGQRALCFPPWLLQARLADSLKAGESLLMSHATKEREG